MVEVVRQVVVLGRDVAVVGERLDRLGGDDLPNDLDHEDIPVSPKYFAGFRSLGSEISTEKSDEEPAWLQDLENTTERAGRAQDKEDLMERLRDLGYM